VQIKRVLQKKLVDSGARRVGWAAGGNGRFAVALGINIETAARKKNARNGGEYLGDALRTLMQRNDDCGRSGGLQRGEIRRERTLVVLRVDGRFGDRDANGQRN